MNSEEGWRVEEGIFGPCLAPEGPWRPRWEALLQERGIKELWLNYAWGFLDPDIEFLRRLPFLEGLSILTYHIPDLSPIESLHGLRGLNDSSRGKRSKIDLANFPLLEEFASDWRYLAGSLFTRRRLRRLGLWFYSGRDTDPFASLPALEDLALVSSQVCDLRGLSGLSKLRRLALHDLRKLESLEGIESLTHLEELDIGTCRRLADIAPVAALHGLRFLNVDNCGDVASLEPIRGLRNLRHLFWGTTNILDGDLSVLDELPERDMTGFQNRRHYNRRCEQYEPWRSSAARRARET